MTYTLAEAQTMLDALLDRALAREEVVLLGRDGEQVRMVALPNPAESVNRAEGRTPTISTEDFRAANISNEAILAAIRDSR